MGKSEIAKLLAIIAAAYPRFEVDDLKVKVWFEMLKDIEYKYAQLAAKKLIMQSVFAPSIAEIRSTVAEMLSPNICTPAEAWGKVLDAVRNFGWYKTEEALKSLDPLTLKVVKYIGWRNICYSDEPDVIRGQFMKMYDQVAKIESEERVLPLELQREIQRVLGEAEVKALAEGE